MMELTYLNSTKDIVLSLHMESCSNFMCEHREVCYHLGKNIDDTASLDINLRERQKILNKNIIIYESICNKLTNDNYFLLKGYNNYNITIPFTLFNDNLRQYLNNVQITINNKHEAKYCVGFQLLYLVKDDSTWNFFTKNHNKAFAKIHYVFDRNYLTHEILHDIIGIRCKSDNKLFTVDSCLNNFVVNGRCPYSYYNYLDLSYDGSVRKCPYDKDGFVKINDINQLYDLYNKEFNCNCIYNKLFNGDKSDAK